MSHFVVVVDVVVRVILTIENMCRFFVHIWHSTSYFLYTYIIFDIASNNVDYVMCDGV